jgi:hypothetical protein
MKALKVEGASQGFAYFPLSSPEKPKVRCWK